jgi:hypothetical protein
LRFYDSPRWYLKIYQYLNFGKFRPPSLVGNRCRTHTACTALQPLQLIGILQSTCSKIERIPHLAWLEKVEKDIYNSNPSKKKFARLSKRLSIYTVNP